MRRLLCAWWLLLMLLGCSAGAYAGAAQPGDVLIIGVPTGPAGLFGLAAWGGNAADREVRTLLHGYATVDWTRAGECVVDATAIREWTVRSGDGQRTYTFTLARDLTYAGGAPIHARDYVFAALLLSSPQLRELGAGLSPYRYLAGYAAYAQGKGPFAGVRLLDEYTFSLTLEGPEADGGEEDLARLDLTPLPLEVIAPGCDVADEGEGAFIQGPFTPALLRRTLLDPDSGYLHFPRETSGPYQLINHNRVTGEVAFARNEAYRGNFEGRRPSFSRIILRPGQEAALLEDLRAGRIHVLHGAADGRVIAQGVELAEKGQLAARYAPRAGLSLLAFAERGPTRFPQVRRAIAMCVDGDALIRGALGGYALPAYGLYGYGQWMAVENAERLTELAAYELNPQGAVTALQEGGWVYNAVGGSFDPRADAVRYRKGEDGALEELAIRWARPVDSVAADALEKSLTEHLGAVGFRLETSSLSPNDLADVRAAGASAYQMWSAELDFPRTFDPEEILTCLGVSDPELLRLGAVLSRTSPGDRRAYIEDWWAFQEAFVSALPLAPLYSNVTFAFAAPGLEGFETDAYWGWAKAAVYARWAGER